MGACGACILDAYLYAEHPLQPARRWTVARLRWATTLHLNLQLQHALPPPPPPSLSQPSPPASSCRSARLYSWFWASSVILPHARFSHKRFILLFSHLTMSQNGCADGAPDGQTWILLSTILVLGMSPGAVKPHDVDPVSNAFAKHSLYFLLSTILHLQFFSNPFLFTGLALFEAGLIRMKNTVTFIAQIFMGVAVLSTMWLLFGFSLSHGADTGGFIGDFANGMFANVSYTRCYDGMRVSEASYATFMMMFAIICPLLMTGGYAERLPFPAFLCVTILWEVIVYYPVSHWVRSTTTPCCLF